MQRRAANLQAPVLHTEHLIATGTSPASPHQTTGRQGARLERAALDDHRGDGPLPAVHLGLDHHRLGAPAAAGPQLQQLRLQQQRLLEVIQAQACQRRHLHNLPQKQRQGLGSGCESV